MARYKEIIKKHFVKTTQRPGQKLELYKCKYCPKTLTFHVTRMADHLTMKCKGCPASTKTSLKMKRENKLYFKLNDDDNDCSDEETTLHEENSRLLEENLNQEHQESTPITIPTTSQSNRSSRVNNFFDRISDKDVSTAHKLLCQAIYASGAPLSMVSNSYWKEFFNFIRPSFPLPSRDQVSNILLNDIYNNTKAAVEKKIKEAIAVGIQCDGWSNIRNEGIINFIVTTPEPVFYKTICTGKNSQTAEFIATEIGMVINSIGQSKVIAVCTDNAACMTKAWAILEVEYEETIQCYGCVAHVLNNVIKDIVKLSSVQNLEKNSKSIICEIKRSHKLLATFTEIQKKDKENTTTLKLPGKTRWGSFVTSLESLSVNQKNLKTLAIDSEISQYCSVSTKNFILSESFWIKINKMITLLKPVLTWITILEGNSGTLSRTCEAFAEIKVHFEKELKNKPEPILTVNEIEVVFEQFQKRQNTTLKPIHFAANILDPVLKGKKLSEEQEASGSSLINDLAEQFELDAEKVLVELTDYIMDEGLWSESYIQKAAQVTPAIKWWKSVCRKTDISKIAGRIFSLPATSAATERSFSMHGWIHNSKRNRLTTDRAGKITYISQNLKFFRNEDNKVTSVPEDEGVLEEEPSDSDASDIL